MKKTIFAAVFAIAAICGTYFNKSAGNVVELSEILKANVDALADDDLCPNGCIKGSGGCHCYIDYPDLKEYPWPEPEEY